MKASAQPGRHLAGERRRSADRESAGLRGACRACGACRKSGYLTSSISAKTPAGGPAPWAEPAWLGTLTIATSHAILAARQPPFTPQELSYESQPPHDRPAGRRPAARGRAA